MHNLFDFLRKYSYVFLFLLLEAVGLALLFRFNSYQGSVAFTAANAGVARINRVYTDVLSFFEMKVVNRSLTDENLRLQRENDALRESLYAVTHDTLLIERLMQKKLADYKLVQAQVVSRSDEKSNNYLVINKGARDGVQSEMGVVSGTGVVGIVYLTGENHSLVIPVTNRKSSISCRVRGQRYFGYLQWDGRSPKHAYVDDVPRYARVKRGEVVETSGYSAVFPPGLFVGRVDGISNSPDGQSYKLDVVLGTNFANLRDVSVVATPYKAEIDTLKVRAEHLEAGE